LCVIAGNLFLSLDALGFIHSYSPLWIHSAEYVWLRAQGAVYLADSRYGRIC
jgi:hypothetical protein